MERKSLKQVLTENAEAVIRIAGTSMEPLLHANESTVLVRKKSGPCKKNDVVLFIRPNGQYVLHRVVGLGNNLRVQGDNQPYAETICEESVIGVMAGYHPYRESEFCCVDSAAYIRYLRLLPLRRGAVSLRRRVCRLLNRGKGIKR